MTQVTRGGEADSERGQDGERMDDVAQGARLDEGDPPRVHGHLPES